MIHKKRTKPDCQDYLHLGTSNEEILLFIKHFLTSQHKQQVFLSCTQEYNLSTSFSQIERPAFEIGVYSTDRMHFDSIDEQEEHYFDQIDDNLLQKDMAKLIEQVHQNTFARVLSNELSTQIRQSDTNYNAILSVPHTGQGMEHSTTFVPVNTLAKDSSTKATGRSLKKNTNTNKKSSKHRSRREPSSAREQRKLESILRQIEQIEEKERKQSKSKSDDSDSGNAEEGSDQEEEEKEKTAHIVYDEEGSDQESAKPRPLKRIRKLKAEKGVIEAPAKKKRKVDKERAKIFKYLQQYITDWISPPVPELKTEQESGDVVDSQSTSDSTPNIPGVSSSAVSHLSAENVEVLSRVMPKLSVVPEQKQSPPSNNSTKSSAPLRSILKKSSSEDSTQENSSPINDSPAVAEEAELHPVQSGDTIFGVKIPKKATTHKLSLAEYAQRKSSMDLPTSQPPIPSPPTTQQDATPTTDNTYPGTPQFSNSPGSAYNVRTGNNHTGMSPSVPFTKPPPPTSSPLPSPSSRNQFSPYPPRSSEQTRSNSYHYPPKPYSPHPYSSNMNRNNPNSPVTPTVSNFQAMLPKPPDLPVPPNQSPKEVLMNWSRQHLKPNQLPRFEPPITTSEGYTSSVVLPHLSDTVIHTKISSPSVQAAENQAAVRAMEHMWRMYSHQAKQRDGIYNR